MPRKATRNTVFLGVVLALTGLYLLLVHGDRYTGHIFAPITVAGHAEAQLPFVEDFNRAKEAVKEQVLFKANLAIARGLQYGPDGIVRGWEQLHKQWARAGRELDEQHPIEQLWYRGRRRWEAMLKRQSTDISAAVIEYKKRYFRPPPRGFDAWFRFCQEHKVKIIDDYDQVEKDIGPWLGIAPAQIRARVKELEDAKHTYTIKLFADGTSTLTGDRASSPRARLQYDLIRPLAALIGTDLTLHASDHNMGSSVISEDLRKLLVDAAGRGTFVTEAELAKHEDPSQASLGLQASCARDALARRISIFRPQPALNEEPMSYIYDVHESSLMNFCNNPKLLRYHGAFSHPFKREARMRPMFQLSRTAHNHEFRMPPLEGFRNNSEAVPWSQKTDDKLFWRGTMTGDHYTQPQPGYRPNYNWRESHRIRLSRFVAPRASDGKEDEDHTWIWVRRETGWEKQSYPRSLLRNTFFDIGLVDKLHQCDGADGTCAQMAAELSFKPRVHASELGKHKYLLDVDGNGWSSRFHRLLSQGSVVLKTTIYPEWYSDWLVPYYHYVPVRGDYEDLTPIMAFFAGTPETSEYPANPGRDDLAKEIGGNARRFTEDHWRWVDMQAYMFRLLLEYRRLLEDDREKFIYSG